MFTVYEIEYLPTQLDTAHITIDTKLKLIYLRPRAIQNYNMNMFSCRIRLDSVEYVNNRLQAIADILATTLQHEKYMTKAEIILAVSNVCADMADPINSTPTMGR